MDLQVLMSRGGTAELTRRGLTPHLGLPLPPEPGGNPFSLPGLVQCRHDPQEAGDHRVLWLVQSHCTCVAEGAEGDAHLFVSSRKVG